jgi:ketosteroid isomerase-like protein
MTITDVAKAFFNGEFQLAYPYLASDITWVVVEENQFSGKAAVIENCEQVAAYFRSVTTRFETHAVIASENKAAVSGIAEFSRNGKQVAFVSACDVYEFDETGMLKTITSYCIAKK